MNLIALSPKDWVNKALQKTPPLRADIERFCASLSRLLEQCNDLESEEHNKNGAGL